MTWLHTWAGLILSWLLYFMFITGSAGYFDEEITRWMQPEIPVQQSEFEATTLIPVAERQLKQLAPYADHLFIEVPQGRHPYFKLWWHNPRVKSEEKPDETHSPGWHELILDPNTGAPANARETAGGEFLYRLHYVLHYIPKDLAYWLTSLAAMFMLVALITGVVIHRRIFKDFFTFRRNKSHTSWLDMHNLLAVLPLPFHLMITYSGLILLMFSTMIAIPVSSYGPSPEKLRGVYDTLFTEPDHLEAAGVAAETVSLLTIYQKSVASKEDITIAYIGVEHPGDVNTIIEVSSMAVRGLDDLNKSLYRGTDGLPFGGPDHHNKQSATMAFYQTMEKLHEGLFASTFLRWIYFLSGLMGAGMIATGAIFWAVKRRHAHDKAGLNPRGLQLVEGFNIGTIVGLPIAIAAYFWANRLIPATFETRIALEGHCLFIIWLLTLIHPFIRQRRIGAKEIWIEQLKVATVAYALIPVINFSTSDYHLLMALKHGDWILAGFDLAVLGIAACFAGAAIIMKKKTRESLTFTAVNEAGL
ncbi:MAG: putative iron-regulated membrane protein [Pseudohongiellaceae bacterium]|jgi:uncharacterized iron-regulated membrane protein